MAVVLALCLVISLLLLGCAHQFPVADAAKSPADAVPTKAIPDFPEVVLSVAGDWSPGVAGNPSRKTVQFMDDLLRRLSGGNVKLKVSGNAEVYADGTAMVQACMAGGLDMVFGGQSRYSQNGLTRFGIFSVPGLMIAGTKGEEVYGERARAFWKDPQGGGVLRQDFEARGLKVISIFADQPIVLEFDRPLGPDDLRGMKIRSPGGKGYQVFYNHFGATMTTLGMPEVYQAFRSGMIDGAQINLGYAVEYKWYEVASYVMNEPFASTYETWTVNAGRYNSLSPEVRKLLDEEVFPQVTAAGNRIFADYLAGIETAWTRVGGKLYKWPEADLLALQAWYPRVAEQFRADYGGLVDVATRY